MPISRNSIPAQTGVPGFPAAHWTCAGAALYLGDVRTCLRSLPTRSVHCAVTSPPYWGLRDYGTATWEGGDPACEHRVRDARCVSGGEGKQWTNNGSNTVYSGDCECGARRVDAQIGLEEVPDCLGWATGDPCGECFVCHMVEVFAEVRRVLRDDGTLWLNLGDTFDNGQLLIPTAVAMALRADGWRVVQDIIWYSPNKMPESVQNRCTKSHEHIFLLAKGTGYYYDAVAIQEPAKSKYKSSDFIPNSDKDKIGDRSSATQASRNGRDNILRQDDVNKRDVWVVPTQGYSGAHFAAFSPKLITPCILAGTSEYGCCAACGRPYERVVSKVASRVPGGDRNQPGDCGASPRKDRDRSFPSQRNGLPGSGSTLDTAVTSRETVGWTKSCACRTDEVEPCVVLDPFSGSGTTVATSLQLGRRGVGIDLSETYIRENAVPRIEAAINGEAVKRGSTAARVVPDDVPSPRRLR